MFDVNLRKNQALLAVAILCSPLITLSYDRIMEGVEEERLECRVYHAAAPAGKRCDNSLYKK